MTAIDILALDRPAIAGNAINNEIEYRRHYSGLINATSRKGRHSLSSTLHEIVSDGRARGASTQVSSAPKPSWNATISAHRRAQEANGLHNAVTCKATMISFTNVVYHI